MLWLRMAIREIGVNRGFSIFFLLNLAVGLAGFIAVQSFGRSIDRHLAANLKEILTADLVVSASSPLTADEAALVDRAVGPDASRAKLVAFYTMVRPEHGPARLVRVMAVGEGYPLYGAFVMEKGETVARLQQSPGLFMTRDTALTLGLRSEEDLSSSLRIGEKAFTILDFFREDPDKSLTSLDLAPKVYMGLDQLDGTGLVRFGSRIRYVTFFSFPDGRDVPALTRTLYGQLFDLSGGKPRVHVFDTRDANRQLGRLTRYFTGYMGMVSIVALFLAGMSAAYLFRGVVSMKQHQMAVLMSTGAVRREVYLFVSLQLVILGAGAALLALGAAALLLPAFPALFRGLVPDGLSPALDPATVLISLGLGMGGSLVFCLPVFARLFRVRPLQLLRSLDNPGAGAGDGRGRTRRILMSLLPYLPGLAAFFLISGAVAGSLKEGLVFASGFMLAMVLLSLAGALVFTGCRYLAERQLPLGWFPVKIALRSLYRNRWASLSCFVTIAMGVFLIALIPQVQKGLESEIMRPEGLKLPVFFLVDIQDDQKGPLTEFMASAPGELSHISPTVQGRILSVNGTPFFERASDPGKKGRPGRMRGRRLEFMFSYRDRLSDSEAVVKGEPLSETPWTWGSEAPFEISVAVSFADRHDLSVGDVLEFDIQGIPLEGKVKNLRKVRWNSFQPNFFLLFQDGVLNDAPKTHLGAISNVPPDQREALKTLLVDRFPNISVIDVTQTAATILAVTDRLSLSVRFMAWLAIAAGLVSIFSIARHQARKNRHQINLLKVLGSRLAALQAVTLVEFGIIGFLSSLFATGLSILFSMAISAYFFDNLWALDLPYLFSIPVLATAVCMATGLAAARKVMRARPLGLLNA